MAKQNKSQSTKPTVEELRDDLRFWVMQERNWFNKLCSEIVRTNDLKKKLWAAEQEIHDLKEYAEKCDRLRNEAEKDLEFAQNLADDTIERNIDLQTELAREQDENDRATDEWEELVAEQDKDIQDLSNWVIDLLQKPTVIDPPACLKPYDALHYAAHHVFYSANSANTTSNIIDY